VNDPERPASALRIGIDLGGSKIEGIALAPDGRELARRRVPTPRSYEGTLRAIQDLVAVLERETGAQGTVGMGIPGTISPRTGLVKNANSTWLMEHPLDHDLTDLLRRPVRLANDANCFALCEATDGAGAGAASVFGVILGTGVGGGIVLEGHVLEGAERIAGEWGHNPLPWPRDDERPGALCYCGKHGCIETFLSGPGMERDHRDATGERRTTYQIVDLLKMHDPGARGAMDRYVDRLARSLATVIDILDPHVIVLGGGMSNLPDLAPRVQDAVGPYVFGGDTAARIVLNAHGDSSGVRGAAWLWPAT